jgi:hypothetical protein
MYIKNIVINDKSLIKYLEILNRIENLVINNIEKIGEFLMIIERRIIIEIDDKVYNRYEYIKESYNEIFLNIQKVVI